MPSTSLQDIYSKTINCICSSILQCQTPSAIFNVDLTASYVDNQNYSVSYVILGSFIGCSESDSLLISTLECFYSDSSCFSIVMSYIKQTYFWNVLDPEWFDVKPLLHNNLNFTRFNPNSSILSILEKVMIEQWNPSYEYETFYHLCSPSYCIYSERIQTNNMIGVIVILLSMIGGLTISLRLITPHLVTIIIKFFSIIMRKQERKQRVDQNWCIRLKLIKQKIIRIVYDVAINLNIFPHRTFGSNVNRVTAKRLGQLTTRLYIVLLIISFILLVIYTLIHEQIMIQDFEKPSFETYNQLTKEYGNKLICSCSSISSTYDQVVHIESTFHPICSSQFVSNSLVNDLSRGLSANLSSYEIRDYRRLILSHIEYLRELCRISIQSVNNSIAQLLSTLLISKELLFEQDFNEHIESLIEQAKQNVPYSLNTIFFLIRQINFGNAIISTYGTNFRYTVPWVNNTSSYLNTEAEIYDNNCSCALYINCTSQAYFIDRSLSNKMVLLKGLKIGCTPTESFHSSTLECFYDQSCIDTIKEFTNYSYSLQSLLLKNESNINNTIGELVQNLFIDEWLTIKNYSSYYQQCLPSLCSYSYTQKFSIIYIISFILGLQGGLTIVLKWICPRVIQFVMKIKTCRKKRSNIVHSDNNHLETISIDVENTNISNITNSRPQFLKIILSCILIMFLTVILIIFSIFIIQPENHSITTIVSSTSLTTSSTQMNITLTTSNSSTRKSDSLKKKILRKTVYFST